jgi:4-diphosphocytidyl-2-C-methyl-D-erythritol kinase
MQIHATPSGLRIATPAKINLFLEVLARRPDGFHELESVMLSVRLYDTLHFSLTDLPEDQLTLLSCGPGVSSSIPLDERNLILKAARLLREATGCPRRCQIRLKKRIPLEAGLGGGSSDAAAALVGLNRLWQLGLSRAELHGLAARLGSDVNFFLDSIVLGLARGRGEQIEPRPLRGGLWLVLVKPPSGCSTREIFQRLVLTDQTHSADLLLNGLATGRLGRLKEHQWNALTPPAVSINSELRELLSEVQACDVLCAGMSGSGSTCFAICRSALQARQLGNRLRNRGYGAVYVTSAGI